MARNILVAFDLDQGSQRALARGLQLAEQRVASLTCLHVLDERKPERFKEEEERQVLEAMRAALPAARRADDDIALRVTEGPVEECLLEAAAQSDAEMIVVGAPRRRALAGLWLGSTVERLLRYGPHPVLIARQASEGPYKRVCLALDESDSSRAAIGEAQRLGLLGSDISLWAVHALRDPGRPLMTHAGIEGDAIAERSARERAGAAARIDTLLNKAGLSRASGIVREAEPLALVRESVEHFEIELLILGTRGSTGIKRLLLGSTAETLIAGVDCDVLAIPTEE